MLVVPVNPEELPSSADGGFGRILLFRAANESNDCFAIYNPTLAEKRKASFCFPIIASGSR